MNNNEFNSNNKKTIALILLIIGLILIGIAVYKLFIQKENETKENNGSKSNPVETTTPTSSPQSSDNVETNPIETPEDELIDLPLDENTIYDLTINELENNKEIEYKINNKKITVKNTKGKLYFNNQYIDESGICNNKSNNGNILYKTNKFIIISCGMNVSDYSYIINENGKLIRISQELGTNDESIEPLFIDNGKLYGFISPSSTNKVVEFAYEIDKMTIKYK